MSEFYDLGAIQESLKNDIAINTAYLDAWCKVSFPTKKDGKPFAILSKNIDGATLSSVSYAMHAGENELTVYTFCNAAGYVHDSISCYELVKYLKDETMLAKTENYQPKITYLEQVYTFDLDDIKQAVCNRIEYLKEYVSDLAKQLEKSKKVFDAFRAAYDSAVKTLQAETSEFAHKDLYCDVFDTIKKRYPYC